MPIYEQTYRRYEARAPLSRARFWPITREALRVILAKRAFLGLLLVGWLPFFFRVIQIYVVTRFPDVRRMTPLDARIFGEFLNGQEFFAIVLTIFGGAGLIANDLRTGGILVYLSRPLTRRDYVLGKLGVLLALNLFVTLVPALLLYALALALAPDTFFKWDLAWVGPAVVLHSLVIALAVSLPSLAISSLSKSARVAGISFFGLLLGTAIVREVLQHAFRIREAAVLSVQSSLQIVGNALFGIASRRFAVDWTYAALVLVVMSVVCLAILRARVRAVEIVR